MVMEVLLHCSWLFHLHIIVFTIATVLTTTALSLAPTPRNVSPVFLPLHHYRYCHEGCRIVSSLNFAPLGFTITERTMGDIGCILSVRRVKCTGEGVSWTR